jgi:hypothetical protein
MRLLILATMLCVCQSAQADDKFFSGPQVGEKLPEFKVRGVFDKEAGIEMDFVAKSNGKPIVLIFVHDLNRQSIKMTRILSQYTHSRVKDGLITGVVWLDEDATEAENTLKRIRHALAKDVAVGISVDGREGPGSYGLNRKVMLTILVGKDGKVTGNFALVQPSLEADLPEILESIVAVAGGEVPKLEELEGMREVMQQRVTQDKTPILRPYLVPVIRLNAPVEDVEKAAKDLIEFVEKDNDAKKELGRIATTIINAGKLSNYGTPRAQEYLTHWAKVYGTKSKDENESPKKPDERK